MFTSNKSVCFCNCLKNCLIIGNITGLTPMTAYHDEQQKCRFRLNKLTIGYSLFLSILLIYKTITLNFNFYDQLEIPLKLTKLNVLIYSICGIFIIVICNLFIAKIWVKTLNKLSQIAEEHQLMCYSSLIAIKRIDNSFVFISIIMLLIQILIYGYFQVKISNFNIFNEWYDRLVQVITIMIICNTLTCSVYLSAIFACYETLILYILLPNLKRIERTNTFFNIKFCKESKHSLYPCELNSLPMLEKIDYLRCLHENICICVRTTINTFKILLVILMPAELVTIVVNIFAVITCLRYEQLSAELYVNFYFDIMYITIHLLALIILLKGGSSLIQMVGEIFIFLLD